MKNTMLFFIGVFIFFVVFGPIFTIFALNTLFGLTIPTTLGTWLAALWLGMVLASRSK
jgi:5-bromo-4-chloroindolyl phosphate hydrolysis protein